MNAKRREFWICAPVLAYVLLGPAVSCRGEPDSATESPVVESPGLAVEEKESVYTEGPRTPDGIGKYYLGREIADYIRGHGAILWLERQTREREEAPKKLVEKLDLAPDAVVADIGAGSGYITFRIAARVPEGRVYAVDIQEEMLEFLEKRKKETGLHQVTPVLGTVEDTKLPEDEVDAAILVDAYHEFSHPYEVMSSVVRSLKDGGRVYLVEYRANDPEVPIKPLHTMTPEQAKKEMEAVGLRWKETLTFLPWQYVFVFEKSTVSGVAKEEVSSSNGSWTRLTGKATVLNAFTLRMEDGSEVDLRFAMDAPEPEQQGLIDGALYPCGKEAAGFLAQLIAGEAVTVFDDSATSEEKRKFRGPCFAGEVHLQTEMVKNGWAVSTHSGMDAWEIIARENERGLWRGEFVHPKEWRKGQRLAAEK